MATNEPSFIDRFLRHWPGGRHIARHWRDDPLSVILLNPGDGPPWEISKITSTFPSTDCERATGFKVLVAPEFPAELCKWYIDEYGHSAHTLPLADFGTCAATLAANELTRVLARGIDHAVAFSGEPWADDGHLGYLVDVAAAANAAHAPLELAVELAPTEWRFDVDAFTQVLATATAR